MRNGVDAVPETKVLLRQPFAPLVALVVALCGDRPHHAGPSQRFRQRRSSTWKESRTSPSTRPSESFPRTERIWLLACPHQPPSAPPFDGNSHPFLIPGFDPPVSVPDAGHTQGPLDSRPGPRLPTMTAPLADDRNTTQAMSSAVPETAGPQPVGSAATTAATALDASTPSASTAPPGASTRYRLSPTGTMTGSADVKG
jgi:hypothetical protein